VINRLRPREGAGRRRLLLYLVGLGILVTSGALAASGISGLISLAPSRWIQVAPNFALGFFGLLVTILLFYAVRREDQMLHLFEWLRRLDSILAGLSAPLTAESLYPACEELAGIFPRKGGWIVLVRAPGLLIRGEVKRRRYLPVVSEAVSGKWNASWAENYLKDRMELGTGRRALVTQLPSGDGPGRALACWISENRAEDITTGMAIALAQGRWRRDKVTMQAMATGLDMLVQRIGSILVEVIERREGLGVENLGLVMRVLAHEINNDLQGALNTMEAVGARPGGMTEDSALHLRSLLARSAHWSHLMREAPFLADNVLPFERHVVSLTAHLRETLEEVRQAWPDVMFVVRRPDGKEEIQVTGDQHLRSVLRNLLHNAASYTPEEGSTEVRIELDEKNAHLVVTDEGPGVDPADVDMIFAPLESMKEGRRAGARVDYGMGVGLTISRAIARAYGGELLCHSNAETHGGVFEVILPLERGEEGNGRG
jgi:signal transduction histidine kinase